MASSLTAGRGGKSGSGDAVKSKGAGGMESGATAGNAAMSPGTRMPGPGSGGSALFATVGSGPNVRSGSGAGAQGGPAGFAAALAVLAAFGAGVMTGRNGASGGRAASRPGAAALPAPGGGPAARSPARGPRGGASWGRAGRAS